VTRLVFKPLAERDLEAIGDYIAADNPVRAVSFVRELRQQCRRIAQNPLGYRARPELDEGLRSCAYDSYVIFFEAKPDEVTVIRILHGARDLPTALSSPEQTN
jgi:toxin ParE1/3/4